MVSNQVHVSPAIPQCLGDLANLTNLAVVKLDQHMLPETMGDFSQHVRGTNIGNKKTSGEIIATKKHHQNWRRVSNSRLICFPAIFTI